MIKINSLSTCKKYNLTAEIILRRSYTIKTKKQLIEKLNSAITSKSESEKIALLKKLDNNEILDILHYFGMIAKIKIVKSEKI